MKSISEILEKNSRANRASLVVFISCGDPDIDFTEKLAKAACAAGADIVELGVPFSDPMADGPTIQAAGQRALASGTTLEKVIEMSGRLRAGGLEN
ncbi:MAG: tryptophan synthase subunit alpha, partial [Opitutales bacterium]|nr:tryptophan synthase subunit alpha [Opitutales bacterium]